MTLGGVTKVPHWVAWLSQKRRLADSNCWKVPVGIAQPCGSFAAHLAADDFVTRTPGAVTLEAVSPTERAEQSDA